MIQVITGKIAEKTNCGTYSSKVDPLDWLDDAQKKKLEQFDQKLQTIFKKKGQKILGIREMIKKCFLEEKTRVTADTLSQSPLFQIDEYEFESNDSIDESALKKIE